MRNLGREPLGGFLSDVFSRSRVPLQATGVRVLLPVSDRSAFATRKAVRIRHERVTVIHRLYLPGEKSGRRPHAE